jgi:hypothetical protein
MDGFMDVHLAIWAIYTVPSGKRLHNCGKSPFLMDKSTINGNFQ